MDEKIIFYIVMGLAYFLFNALKKKRGQEQTQNERPDTDFLPQQRPQHTPRKQLTFEELLKEISESKTPAKTTTPYVDYDDQIGEEEQDLEEVSTDYSKSQTYDIYEKAKNEAFLRPSLEVSTDEERNVRFGKFDVFEEDKGEALLERYTRELRDPEGFKKAFILSEVLNRRHF